MLPDPAGRFNGRVESYRRYRPGYPAEIVDLLMRQCRLRNDAMVGDIAAGTGLLSEIFLAAGFAVTAVEPNAEMRAACSELKEQYNKLQVVAGTAEATGLADRSVDLVTAAQAMHWFDLERTRREFLRILKPGGWCAAIYNTLRSEGDALHVGLEGIQREFGIDYLSVRQQLVSDERLAEFYAPAEMKYVMFPNARTLTEEALEGRILSASYMPQPGDARFEEMIAAIKRLFAENQSGGMVTVRYDCVMRYAQLGSVG